MNNLEIIHTRIYNQLISQTGFEQPGQTAAWFGAMQAQDYSGVKWGIGLRTAEATEGTINQAVADHSIIRTWLMRGSLHFAAGKDVRWMLKLLAPRIIASSARRYKQLELSEEDFSDSYEILNRALNDKNPLTRAEIFHSLDQAGISVEGQRGNHILRRAGLEGVICYGPFKGKSETYVLLDDCGTDRLALEKDEALAELTLRYFQSHGPATLEDYRWWSGLRAADARTGINLNQPHLVEEIIGDFSYWFLEEQVQAINSAPSGVLLPAYDEYVLGYKARDLFLNPKFDTKAVSNNGVFRPVIVIDGQILGTWKHKVKRHSRSISLNSFKSMTGTQIKALEEAIDQYAAFVGQPINLD